MTPGDSIGIDIAGAGAAGGGSTAGAATSNESVDDEPSALLLRNTANEAFIRMDKFLLSRSTLGLYRECLRMAAIIGREVRASWLVCAE